LKRLTVLLQLAVPLLLQLHLMPAHKEHSSLQERAVAVAVLQTVVLQQLAQQQQQAPATPLLLLLMQQLLQQHSAHQKLRRSRLSS
jgi:hypothetical protein